VNVCACIDARTETVGRVADEVAQVIYGGGTVIFPTDTVYGIGCDPYLIGAIDRIYGAKRRPDHKPLSIHLATVAEFLEYFGDGATATAPIAPPKNPSETGVQEEPPSTVFQTPPPHDPK